MYDVLFRSVLFPAYERLVRRRATPSHLAEYEASQWLDGAALAELQLKKLNALLAYCWQQVPFLQRHWRAHGCQPAPLGSLHEFQRYPLLTKADISGHYQDMIARPWQGKTLSKTTGGSTGDPFRFEYSMDVYARRTAVMWRGYGWGGARLGTRTAYLWGTGLRSGGWGGLKDRLYHGAFNRRFFDAFGLQQANLDATLQAMQRYRPEAVVGYVRPLVLVAQRMLDSGRAMSGVRGVLTGAEALFGPERKLIEQAFGCPVFDTYGSREVMLMASECDQHRGLHVNADHLLLEAVDDGGRPVAPGHSGDVVVSDFHNLAMPMVRYVNGDRVTYAAHGCSCGRGLPLLAGVDGRILDLIVTPDGRQLVGEFFVYAVLDFPDIRQWQVVQTAADAVQVRLVLSHPWAEAQRQRLIDKIALRSGPVMRVEVVEVAAIADTPSGKRRLCIALAKTHKTS